MQRDLWLDKLRAFAMFLVIVGHIITNCVEFGRDTYICGVIYHIHIPLFLFISGLLAKDKEMNIEFWGGIIRRFLIPYTIWNVVLNLWSLGAKKIVSGGLLFTLQHIVNDRWMWFIPSFVAVYLCWQFLKPLASWKRMLIGLFMIYAVGGFSISLWCYFWYGAAASLRDSPSICAKKLFLLLVFMSSLLLPISFDNSYVMFLMQPHLISFSNWDEFLVQIITGLSFCLLVLSMRNWEDKKYTLLGKIGQETLPIYMLQTFLVEAVLPRILQLPRTIVSFLIVFIIAAGMITLCYVIIKQSSKIRLCRLILWGNK